MLTDSGKMFGPDFRLLHDKRHSTCCVEGRRTSLFRPHVWDVRVAVKNKTAFVSGSVSERDRVMTSESSSLCIICS